MQGAIDTRETAIISAHNNYNTALISLLTSRKTELKSAWGLSDKDARKAAIKSAWDKFKTGKKALKDTRNSSIK